MNLMTKGEKTWQIVINVVMILVVIIIVAPFLLLFLSSITEESVLLTNLKQCSAWGISQKKLHPYARWSIAI